MMKLYFISGEASGDLYGSRLATAFRQENQGVKMRGWGGDLMQNAGVEIVKHYRDLAFMGFLEVLLNLRTILKNMRYCKEDVLAFKPDALVLVDYPGFNLRIAKWAKENKIRVFYYISPGVWAWKAGRVNQIRDNVERLYTIFPFEKKFYADRNVTVDYFGNPLAEIIGEFASKMESKSEYIKKHSLSEKPIIAMLPGSRSQELIHILPEMLKVVKHFPEYQFVVAASNSLPNEIYEKIKKEYGITVVVNDTYPLLFHARGGLIKSGTSTLEAALFKLPHVVCYKANAISLFIARRVATVNFFSLVNIIFDRLVVPELLQEEMNELRMVEELRLLLTEGPKRKQTLAEFETLENMLKSEGVAKKVALDICKRISQ